METGNRVMWIVARHGTVIVALGLLVLGLVAGSASAADFQTEQDYLRYFYGKML